MDFGILAGMGQRARERHREEEEQRRYDFEQNQKNLLSMASMWGHIAEMPNISPEGQQYALSKMIQIHGWDPTKKPPKDFADFSAIARGIPAQMGASWMGSKTKRAIQAYPMPIPGALPEPGRPQLPDLREIQAGAIPGLEDEPQQRWTPPVQEFEVPMPTPPPEMTTPFFTPYSELQRRKSEEMKQEERFKTDEAIRRGTALAEAEEAAKARYYIPPPRNIDPLSAAARQSRIEEEEELRKRGLGIYRPDTGTSKSVQESEVILKSGDRVMAVFNPNPDDPGWFRKDPQSGEWVNITTDIAGLYRQPPATIQIAAATQAAQGMPPDFTEALSRSTMQLPQQQRLQVYDTVNQMFNRGNTSGARSTIKQAALSQQPVAVQVRLLAQREAINSLQEIRLLLDKVPTNLLIGTFENVLRRLGATANSEYTRIAERLRMLQQSYRRGMTGAQFSIPEAAEYASILPDLSNFPAVNTALMDAMLEEFRSQNDVFWNGILPPGWSDRFDSPVVAETTPRVKKTPKEPIPFTPE